MPIADPEIYLPEITKLAQISDLAIYSLASGTNGSGSSAFRKVPFSLLANSPHIKSFHFRDSQLSDQPLSELGSLPQLESLDLDTRSARSLPNIRNAPGPLSLLARACPNLRRLRVQSEKISNRDIEEAVPRFTRIEELELVDAKITRDCVPDLAELKTLKKLTLIRSGFRSEDKEVLSRLCQDAVFCFRLNEYS